MTNIFTKCRFGINGHTDGHTTGPSTGTDITTVELKIGIKFSAYQKGAAERPDECSATLVHLSRSKVSPILTHRCFKRFSTCILAVSGVSLVGVSLPSADVAVAVVRPEVKIERVFITIDRTRANWKAPVKAHTIVQ